MSAAGALIREARKRQRLTQADLARRLGISQSAVARLEAPTSNPTFATLEEVLNATGERLEVSSSTVEAGVDETLIARQLRATPADRLRAFEEAYADVRTLAGMATGARGRVA